MIEFRPFPKIARLRREMIVTEKIDGTNAQVTVLEDGTVLAGSRNRWITPEADNHGFARWVKEHEDELREGLGIGTHFGEWWGKGIQRGYGLTEKRFSLFDVSRWSRVGEATLPGAVEVPSCCHVVPVLIVDTFSTGVAEAVLRELRKYGSVASLGFMDVEGVVVFHAHSRTLFKLTVDDGHKGDA